MDKNDFDLDFDFEKEYGFDPNTFLGNEESDEDVDLSEFSDEALGLTSHPEKNGDEAGPDDDFDLDVDLDEFMNLGSGEDDSAEGLAGDDGLTDEPDDARNTEDDDAEDTRWSEDAELSEDTEHEAIEMNANETYPDDSGLDIQTEFEDEPVDDEENTPVPPKRRKKSKPKKTAGPNLFTKFYDLYFAPLLDKSVQDAPPDPNNPRRRRKKSKAQLFKEVYLPPIIACVCLILVLSFAIGALSNFIQQKKIDEEISSSRQESTQSESELAQQEYQRIMAEAAGLAAGYDYQGAIDLLDSFADQSSYPDMVALRAQYVSTQSSLVEYNDPTSIANLSFHVLIVDLARAIADTDLGPKYNRNFVSTTEFSKILNDLYNNGYVLVDFDSFAPINGDRILTDSIYLPEGKKPFMLTETLVNYLEYMIDSNGDGEADSGGAGFASKLVLDSNGDIKAEYVDASGSTLVGDYDLVPILESFIQEHPDFAYRGARATVAVCGYQGVFGYRINSSYAASKGTTYQEEQIAGAKAIAQALRDKGYTIACYSYDNVDYANMNTNQITSDLQSWTNQIVTVIGEVNTFVFAQESNITEYGTGTAYNVMYNSGFRYFVSSASTPYTEVTSSYVRQNRLMVTGRTMTYYSGWFTGMFDCAAILDVNTRGNVPNN